MVNKGVREIPVGRETQMKKVCFTFTDTIALGLA